MSRGAYWARMATNAGNRENNEAIESQPTVDRCCCAIWTLLAIASAACVAIVVLLFMDKIHLNDSNEGEPNRMLRPGM